MGSDWADEKAEELIQLDRNYAMGAIAKSLRDAYQKGRDDEFDANEETWELNV